nr:hypothetical protein CFP56_05797 [Quercus suber]
MLLLKQRLSPSKVPSPPTLPPNPHNLTLGGTLPMRIHLSFPSFKMPIPCTTIFTNPTLFLYYLNPLLSHTNQ